MLHTTTLADSTLDLLKKLQSLPELVNTRLVGGTALALQLGHRISTDLDFFGNVPEDLETKLETRDFSVIIIRSHRNIKHFNIDGVKTDFVNYPYAWLGSAVECDGIRLAGIADIAAMKLSAITNRGTKRDFVDIYFLLHQFTMKQMTELYQKKYPDGALFNVLQSLTYFADAEAFPMPKMLVNTDWDEVKTTIRTEVAKLA